MKVLLTGATGFLGSEIARQLVAAGHELRVLIRKQSKLDVVFLVVNTLSTAGAQSLSDTYRLRNNPFGDALSSASGHFSTIQAELLLRFRN